jgi:hypothetical protein
MPEKTHPSTIYSDSHRLIWPVQRRTRSK